MSFDWQLPTCLSSSPSCAMSLFRSCVSDAGWVPTLGHKGQIREEQRFSGVGHAPDRTLPQRDIDCNRLTSMLFFPDKNSLFEGSSIGKTGLGVKKNLTTGYCGGNGGLQHGGLSSGQAWMCWACHALLWHRGIWKWWKLE